MRQAHQESSRPFVQRRYGVRFPRVLGNFRSEALIRGLLLSFLTIGRVRQLLWCLRPRLGYGVYGFPDALSTAQDHIGFIQRC
jgi:hypothetical protein